MRPAPQIRIVIDGPIPVYRQIADAIRAHCVSGRLASGEKLPTIRELAASLGIHFNTVAEAYRVLSEEGWVMLERRRGATVLDRLKPRAPGAAASTGEGDRLRRLVAELQGKGFPKDWIRREVQAALESTK